MLGGLTGSPGGNNIEVALDIDMAISMAPGLSTVYVYEATNDAASPDIIFNGLVSDNLSRQLSCSWGGFDDPTIEQDFLEFAAQGQSFFQASGDSGAYDDVQNQVVPPSDNPNITVVGGTTLKTTGPAGSWVSETVWSWFNQSLGSAASSGGISPTWSLPTWQSGISMSANKGSTTYRNLPDVALTADDIFLFANDGGEYWVGGTSAAAPLWAGLTALLNQQLAAEAQPPAGFLNPAIYALAKGSNYSSCFHDITVGNNTNGYTATQFFATNGYDLCTGWGTPIGQALIRVLAPPEPLAVSPFTGWAFSGPYGGPFTVTNLAFTLTNAAASSLRWAVGADASWFSVSSSGGTLAAGAAVTVTVSPNASVTNLAAAAYANNIWFTNVSDSVVQSRPIDLIISPVTPTVTWGAPASIPYGTALSALQLDATASVLGSFVYDPPSGTVPAVGTNLLTAVFTPTDALDYGNATTNVVLVVTAVASMSGDTPLFPEWGMPAMLAAMALLGMAVLRHRPISLKP